MKYPALAIAAAVALSTPALAQTSGSAGAQKTLTPAQFVEVAAVSDMFEIESSRAALQKVQTPEVKTFAQQMINDHTKASTELKAVAAKLGGDVKIPTTLDAEHAKLLQDINAETGDDFEEEYIEAQVMAHEKAVALFGDYAKSGSNAELKAFAAKTLPTLQMHYEHVQKLDK
jgi:putative membrane protein